MEVMVVLFAGRLVAGRLAREVHLREPALLHPGHQPRQQGVNAGMGVAARVADVALADPERRDPLLDRWLTVHEQHLPEEGRILVAHAPADLVDRVLADPREELFVHRRHALGRAFQALSVDVLAYALEDLSHGIGNQTRVKVVKNKVAPPFKLVEFDIMYGEGISREGDLLDLAVVQRVVEKSGAWFSYKGERLGQGRENAKTAMRDNPEVLRN